MDDFSLLATRLADSKNRSLPKRGRLTCVQHMLLTLFSEAFGEITLLTRSARRLITKVVMYRATGETTVFTY